MSKKVKAHGNNVEAREIDTNAVEKNSTDEEHTISLDIKDQHLKAPDVLLRARAALEVANTINRAWDLIARHLYDDAWHALLEAERVALRAGIRSAFLAWGLAVAADYRGDAESAVKHIALALKADPCSPPIRASHLIIAERVRAAFNKLDPADANGSATRPAPSLRRPQRSASARRASTAEPQGC